MQSTQSQEKGLAVQKTPTPSSPEQAEKRDNQIPMSERLKIGFTGKNPAAQETDLLTEEEINQMADQYASVDFDMDEDMLNDDDLLDEELEENIVIPETQECEKQSNLPQQEEDRAVRDVGKEKEKEKTTTKKPRPAASKEQELSKKAQKDMMPQISINKHRGTRSPDTKGAAASKKLTIRGRASPKGKLVRHGRLSSSKVSDPMSIPRFEVYPSAAKGRKSTAVSGSVGSKKPPSTQI
ncbi:hypothetical protein F2Q70_00025738 [Brassica cretica]|nr:hypothetical protein F2Q70_00025738 [Brassica cretica]